MLANNPDPQSRQVAREKRVQKVIKYLGLSGTGIGISGIVGLLVNGQFKAAILLGLFTIGVTVIAIAYKFVSGVTNRVLDKIEEELENLEEPVAKWIVNQPKRLFTWCWWWKLNSQFQISITPYMANCLNNLLTIILIMQNSVKHIVSKLLVLYLFSKILFDTVNYFV